MNNLPNKYIPKNESYCYERLVEDGVKVKILNVCPYWDRTGEFSGSCAYLDIDEKDYDDVSLLFDMIKCCGENL